MSTSSRKRRGEAMLLAAGVSLPAIPETEACVAEPPAKLRRTTRGSATSAAAASTESDEPSVSKRPDDLPQKLQLLYNIYGALHAWGGFVGFALRTWIQEDPVCVEARISP